MCNKGDVMISKYSIDLKNILNDLKEHKFEIVYLVGQDVTDPTCLYSSYSRSARILPALTQLDSSAKTN